MSPRVPSPGDRPTSDSEPGDAFTAVAAALCTACDALVTPGVDRVVVRHSRVYHAAHAPDGGGDG